MIRKQQRASPAPGCETGRSHGGLQAALPIVPVIPRGCPGQAGRGCSGPGCCGPGTHRTCWAGGGRPGRARPVAPTAAGASPAAEGPLNRAMGLASFPLEAAAGELHSHGLLRSSREKALAAGTMAGGLARPTPPPLRVLALLRGGYSSYCRLPAPQRPDPDTGAARGSARLRYRHRHSPGLGPAPLPHRHSPQLGLAALPGRAQPGAQPGTAPDTGTARSSARHRSQGGHIPELGPAPLLTRDPQCPAPGAAPPASAALLRPPGDGTDPLSPSSCSLPSRPASARCSGRPPCLRQSLPTTHTAVQKPRRGDTGWGDSAAQRPAENTELCAGEGGRAWKKVSGHG